MNPKLNETIRMVLGIKWESNAHNWVMPDVTRQTGTLTEQAC